MWLLTARDHRLRALWPSVSSLAVDRSRGSPARPASSSVDGSCHGDRPVVDDIRPADRDQGAAARRARRARQRWPAAGSCAAAIRPASAGTRALPELRVVIAALVGRVGARPVASSSLRLRPSRHRSSRPTPDLTVSASIEPARPGPNLVQVRVLDTRRPSPGPVDSVTVRVVGGDGAVVAERRRTGRRVSSSGPTLPFRIPGCYRVEVDVDRPPLPVSAVRRFMAGRSGSRAPSRPWSRPDSWAPFAAHLAAVWVAAGGCRMVGDTAVFARTSRQRLGADHPMR